MKILLAVDDSPASLAAARLAVRLCAAIGAELFVVSVVANHAVAGQLQGSMPTRSPSPSLQGATAHEGAIATQLRREQGADLLLHYVGGLAARAAVPAVTVQVSGDVAPGILDQAKTYACDLIVLGRSRLAGTGQPYVGSHTRHVLEFAEVPVLVVPPPGPRAGTEG